MLKTRPKLVNQYTGEAANAMKKPTGKTDVNGRASGATDQSAIKPTNVRWSQLVAGNFEGNHIQRKCEQCDQCEQEEKLPIQTSLTVGPANDVYEREADAVANQVMSKSGTSIGTISSLKQPQTLAKTENSYSQTTYNDGKTPNRLSAYVSTLNGKGKSLSKAESRFFSSRFNRSFDGVRLHTNSEANQAAKGIQAKAFTYGNHIVFNHGAYQANQPKSMNLLAHELTHVVQQGGANGAVSRKPDDGSGWIQRTAEGELTPEQVGQDPGLLLCFILCELGIPPSIWRDITGLILQAVWEEYKARYTKLQANVAFRRFETQFQDYSLLKIVQFALTLIIQKKIGLIPIKSVAGIAACNRLKTMLIARGATSAGLVAAEQIARKVVLAIEIAIAIGCATYCGSAALARTIIAMTEALAEGIVVFVEGLEAAGEIMGSLIGGIATELIVRPIFISLAMADIYNWDLAGMPASTRADTLVMGWYLSSQLDGEDLDTLLTQLSKPINRYPNDFQDLVFMTMNEIIEQRNELNEPPLQYTAREMLQQTPIAFIRLLNKEGYLLFNQDPNDVADAMINGGEETEGEE